MKLECEEENLQKGVERYKARKMEGGGQCAKREKMLEEKQVGLKRNGVIKARGERLDGKDGGRKGGKRGDGQRA